MICPVCGGAELVREARDMPYVYKGVTTIIPQVFGDHCPACRDCILTRESGDQYSAAIGAARAKVDASQGAAT